jgi:hypothetical protein
MVQQVGMERSDDICSPLVRLSFEDHYHYFKYVQVDISSAKHVYHTHILSHPAHFTY